MTTASNNEQAGLDLFAETASDQGAKPVDMQPSKSAPGLSGKVDSKPDDQADIHAIPNDGVVPDKRYFTISEAADLCGTKPHVLRYWESEFKQLSPVKRAGNRRYYQRQDIFLIRQIRELLHEQGFTIAGARQNLAGKHSKESLSQNKQILREVRQELEQLLKSMKS